MASLTELLNVAASLQASERRSDSVFSTIDDFTGGFKSGISPNSEELIQAKNILELKERKNKIKEDKVNQQIMQEIFKKEFNIDLGDQEVDPRITDNDRLGLDEDDEDSGIKTDAGKISQIVNEKKSGTGNFELEPSIPVTSKLGVKVIKKTDQLKNLKLSATKSGNILKGNETEVELLNMIAEKFKLEEPLNRLVAEGKSAQAAEILGRQDLLKRLKDGEPFESVVAELGEGTGINFNEIMDAQPEVIQAKEDMQIGRNVLGDDLLITTFKLDKAGEIIPNRIISKEGIRQEKILGEAIKASGKQLQEFTKTGRNLARIEAASSNLIAFGKQAIEEMGGFGAIQFGIAKAKQAFAVSGIGELIGKPVPLEEQQSGLKKFEGQLVEMTLAMSPILTGQNRIIEGVVRMLAKTLPKFPTTEAAFVGQLRQTVKNAFRLTLSLSKSLTTLEDFQELQEADPEVVDEFMEQLITKTAFTQDDERLFKEIWTRIKSTPAALPEGFETPPSNIAVVGPVVGPTGGQIDQDFDIRVNSTLDNLGF